MRYLIALLVSLFWLASNTYLPAEEVDFAKEIKPVFNKHCVHCHGPAERNGGLSLTSRKRLIGLNDSGEPAIVPGKSHLSELIRRITSKDDAEWMPPEGDRLTAQEIASLKKWIDAGANWPADQELKISHWSYEKPVRPTRPKVKDSDWPTNAIDYFILAKLEEHQIDPSSRAEPARLLRRVYLDMIGMPPAPEDVQAFEQNPTQQHYEKIVDKLLQSKQYGVKWARQWLDLARYADSNGYQADQLRNIWPYRDWVIDAINADMPFDQFSIAQLSGDLLPGATSSQKIATGFHRCTTCNVEAGVDPEENRVNQIIDRVNTTGTVWLGTTLECAQCHNHKYDPFSQQDYYQIFAFFNNTPLEVKQKGNSVTFEVGGPQIALPLSDKAQSEKQKLQDQLAYLKQEIKSQKAAIDKQLSERIAAIKPAAEKATGWHTLDISDFHSQIDAGFERKADQSILITGAAQQKDTYELFVTTDLKGITRFKLEALTDPQLPGKGPGRHHTAKPNFVLYEFKVAVIDDQSKTETPVLLTAAEADFSQQRWDVTGLIDDNPKTGWAIAPEFHKSHWATFQTKTPLQNNDKITLKITLPQHYGGNRTIGRLRLSAMTGDPALQKLPEEIKQIAQLDDSERNPKQLTKLKEYFHQQNEPLAQLVKKEAACKKQLAKIEPVTSPVMVEMDQMRNTSIFKRGDFLNKGRTVKPKTPEALHPLTMPSDQKLNRLQFARWLMSKENPLVARVTVNRWWAEIFGQGIVTTLEDFGAQGEPPTHPRLLDWLAVEFMSHNWSMKQMHRLIVTSSTYQQSSKVSPDLLAVDPYNKLYTRGARIRLSAELIRDNALAISGLLSEKMAGPPVYPPQPDNIWRHLGRNAPKYVASTGEDRYRRGIYTIWRRSAPYPSFVNFDAPDRSACTIKRSRTNTPLQALTLLNDPAFVEITFGLAKRLSNAELDMKNRERIALGFRLCLSRDANKQEIDHLLRVFNREKLKYSQNIAAAKALVGKHTKTTDEQELTELAAWFYVSSILLNLDETITKS